MSQAKPFPKEKLYTQGEICNLSSLSRAGIRQLRNLGLIENLTSNTASRQKYSTPEVLYCRLIYEFVEFYYISPFPTIIKFFDSFGKYKEDLLSARYGKITWESWKKWNQGQVESKLILSNEISGITNKFRNDLRSNGIDERKLPDNKVECIFDLECLRNRLNIDCI